MAREVVPEQTTGNTTRPPQRPTHNTEFEGLNLEKSRRRVEALQAEHDTLLAIYRYLQTADWQDALTFTQRLRGGDDLEFLFRTIEASSTARGGV